MNLFCRFSSFDVGTPMFALGEMNSSTKEAIILFSGIVGAALVFGIGMMIANKRRKHATRQQEREHALRFRPKRPNTNTAEGADKAAAAAAIRESKDQ